MRIAGNKRRNTVGALLQTHIRVLFLQAWLDTQPPWQGRDLAWIKTEFNKVYPGIIDGDLRWCYIMSRIPDLVAYDVYAGHGQLDVTAHLYSWRMPLLPEQKQQTKLQSQS